MCTFMYTCSDTKDSNMDIQVPVTSKSSQQRFRVVRRSFVARRRFTRRGRRATPAPFGSSDGRTPQTLAFPREQLEQCGPEHPTC